MGTVTYSYKISHAYMLMTNVEQEINKTIDRILSIMPMDTEHISINQKEIIATYAQFDLVFKHPLFEDGTVLDLQYERDVCPNPEGGLLQFTVLTGFKFIKPDGTFKY